VKAGGIAESDSTDEDPSKRDDGDAEAAPAIVEVLDEREPLARAALALIESAFPPNQRQPLNQIAMEVAEKRMGLLTSYDFHLLAAPEGDDVAAVAAGLYLGGVNAGFVTYLAVRPEHRARHLGRMMRSRLVKCFGEDARRAEWDELRWVLGEVRIDNPWLQRLVRDRAAIPFDLRYYHPGIAPVESGEHWVLYRQPVGDFREALPAVEVRQLIYAIWRRAYRVRWPLERDGFVAMLKELEGREMVGAHANTIHHS
jgi:ribosomal protein S18 acetylase RimI-like enzyme